MKSILKNTLKKKSVTITELARNTGISRSLLSQLANSEQVPGKTRIDVITRIMTSIHCNLSDILQPEVTDLHVIYSKKLEDAKKIAITNRYLTILGLKIEGVSQIFPLLTSTVSEPSKDVFTGEYEKNSKTNLSLTIDLLNNQDEFYLCTMDKKLKKYFPNNYNYLDAKDQLLSISFVLADISLFLLNDSTFDVNEYDFSTLPPVFLNWNIDYLSVNSNFVYRLDFSDPKKVSLKLEEDEFPIGAHLEISEIFHARMKQLGSKLKKH